MTKDKPVLRPAPTPENNSRMRDLLNGKREPPNKFVAYLIEKAKDASGEFMVVQKNAAHTRKTLQQNEDRLLELKGEYNKYIEDIRAWDKEVIDGEGSAPEAPEETAS